MPDKYIDDDSMDAGLKDIANSGDQFHLCSAAPSDYADALNKSLGFVTLTPGDGNGSYTIQNGAVSGRRLNLTQQTVPGTAPGTATHAVILDSVNSKVKTIDTAPNYTMAVGVNQTVPSFDVWEIEDPT
jgi:hypothetical protein